MKDQPIEFRRDEFTVSTDRRRLDLDAVRSLLATTHWGIGMGREVIERAVENSICFGVYHGQHNIGLARVVTDLATYAYLTDVLIAGSYRGCGLGQWLVQCILNHPELQGLRRIALVTRNAQALYARYGFGTDTGTVTYMEFRDPQEGRALPSAK
jgi:ribosomal protein S18 acetylase RimI-like enzyme